MIQIIKLRGRTSKKEIEVKPLQEKNIVLATKADQMQTKNISLRAEAASEDVNWENKQSKDVNWENKP